MGEMKHDVDGVNVGSTTPTQKGTAGRDAWPCRCEYRMVSMPSPSDKALHSWKGERLSRLVLLARDLALALGRQALSSLQADTT